MGMNRNRVIRYTAADTTPRPSGLHEQHQDNTTAERYNCTYDGGLYLDHLHFVIRFLVEVSAEQLGFYEALFNRFRTY